MLAQEDMTRRLDADGQRAQTSAMAVFPDSGIRPRSHAVPMRRFPRPAKDAAQMSVRYAVADYAVDQIQDLNQLVSAFEPLSDSHYRWHMKEPFGSGRYEFCALADGFFVTFAETEYQTPQATYFSSPDSLHIYLASSGDGEYVPVDGEPLSFEAPSTVFIVEPAHQPLAEVTLAGVTRYIYIVVHREVLKTLYAGSAHELPPLLQAFLDGDLQRTSGRALPLSAAMLRCLEDVQTCPVDGRRRRLFLQSKALEIICQALEAFDQSECFRSAETTKLIARGVVKAQRFLEANYVTPPSLDELAVEVGLSRSALCTGFRQILGQSVFDYVQDLRMQRALALLSKGDDPITQIAYAVGYNRSSSFSVAVNRHFGTTPSKLRQRGTSFHPR
ncbi:AraC family transcriptional regulator [Sphingomonas sp. QA11]|uniref:helix-turn-helix transcriptional regulator n=1 Tax=Sphingomonas sp. QA11 TaxID=2950605 RepID=UPI002349D3C6|nr:AraC family transcriptional regulator [Sphingomonas sp. QA11]WCM29458.1 AraC family transcriptional regulator [Sphingomonas sp. QA11]